MIPKADLLKKKARPLILGRIVHISHSRLMSPLAEGTSKWFGMGLFGHNIRNASSSCHGYSAQRYWDKNENRELEPKT